MTENIFRNSRGTFTCDDCGQAATVPSLIKHSEDCEGAQMTDAEVKEITKRFRADWPTIEKDPSQKAQTVRHLADLYKAHQDWPTFAMMIAAHTEWKKERR